MNEVLMIYAIFPASCASNVTIKSQVQEVQLLMNHEQNLTFLIFNDASILAPAKINFEASFNGVVSINPTSVEVTKDLKNFSIDFVATDAGRTTVKATVDNSSSQQVE